MQWLTSLHASTHASRTLCFACIFQCFTEPFTKTSKWPHVPTSNGVTILLNLAAPSKSKLMNFWSVFTSVCLCWGSRRCNQRFTEPSTNTSMHKNIKVTTCSNKHWRNNSLESISISICRCRCTSISISGCMPISTSRYRYRYTSLSLSLSLYIYIDIDI